MSSVLPQMIEIVLEPLSDSAMPRRVKVVLEDPSRLATREEGEADLDLSGKRVQIGDEEEKAEVIRQRSLEDDQAVQEFIDQLEAGRIHRIRRLTYAEVTQDGPKLRFWPSQS